jgi:hypothetical protein
MLASQYYMLLSTGSPDSPQATHILNIIKTWYAARAVEGGTTKNINSMSVLYTLTSLMELHNEKGGIFDEREEALYSRWIHEWGEWVMNELPSGLCCRWRLSCPV